MKIWGKISLAFGALFVLVFGLVGNAVAQTGSSTVTATLDDLQDQIDDLADEIDDIDDDGDGNTQSQDQTQAQTQNVNLAGGGGRGGGGGSKLPKTGVDAAEVGGIGTASLIAGLALTEFARRRRRNWIAPVSTVATPSPRAGTSEGELLLPYFSD